MSGLLSGEISSTSQPISILFFGRAMQLSLCSQECGRSPAINIIVSVCPACPDSAQRRARAPTGQEGLLLEAREQGGRGTKYCHQTTSFVKTYRCQRVREQDLYQPPSWASARASELHSVLEACANSHSSTCIQAQQGHGGCGEHSPTHTEFVATRVGSELQGIRLGAPLKFLGESREEGAQVIYNDQQLA